MPTAGDFEEFVRARYAGLCRYAFALCSDWHEAEDLVQAALSRCYPRYRRGLENPEAYLLTAVLNAHRSSRRRFWHREVPSAVLPDRAVPVVDPAEGDEVLTALRKLPLPQRAVVVLRFLCDLSEEQTAAVIGVPVGTVKSRTARALRAIREDLDPDTGPALGRRPVRIGMDVNADVERPS
jgi:RNA polymerase sigma-70 factor (sigma-E family)